MYNSRSSRRGVEQVELAAVCLEAEAEEAFRAAGEGSRRRSQAGRLESSETDGKTLCCCPVLALVIWSCVSNFQLMNLFKKGKLGAGQVLGGNPINHIFCNSFKLSSLGKVRVFFPHMF